MLSALLALAGAYVAARRVRSLPLLLLTAIPIGVTAGVVGNLALNWLTNYYTPPQIIARMVGSSALNFVIAAVAALFFRFALWKGSAPALPNVKRNAQSKHQAAVSTCNEQSAQPPVNATGSSSLDNLYELAANELEGGDRKKGVWAHALADADGDEQVARARYIRLRVSELEAAERAQQMRLAEEEKHRIAEAKNADKLRREDAIRAWEKQERVQSEVDLAEQQYICADRSPGVLKALFFIVSFIFVTITLALLLGYVLSH